MAKIFKLKDMLRSGDQDDTRTEQTDEMSELRDKAAPVNPRNLPPFQRVKLGAGDMFLAEEAIPRLNWTN